MTNINYKIYHHEYINNKVNILSQKDIDSLGCPRNQLLPSLFHPGYIPGNRI